MEQVKTKSVEPQQRFALSEVTWDDLNEAGAYVERGSGDLYRIPKEALIPILEARLRGSRTDELRTALREILAIAEDRSKHEES